MQDRPFDEEKHETPHVIALDETDFYKVLNVSHDATVEEIKKSFRKLALIYHPDKKPYGNADIFKKLNEAYCVLCAADLRHDDRFSEVKNGQDFYIIGKPIPFKKTTNSSQKLFDGDFKSQVRSSISSQEIINSFPAGESIYLFRRLSNAFFYARSMMVGNFYTDQACLQPAVFKVSYHYELETLKLEYKAFEIVEEYKTNRRYDKHCLNYCVTNADNVTPLIAYLKLELVCAGIYNEYPEIHLTQLENDNSKKSVIFK